MEYDYDWEAHDLWEKKAAERVGLVPIWFAALKRMGLAGEVLFEQLIEKIQLHPRWPAFLKEEIRTIRGIEGTKLDVLTDQEILEVFKHWYVLEFVLCDGK